MRAWFVLMLAGCSFRGGSSTTGEPDAARDAVPDAAVDAPRDAGPPDAYACSAAGLVCAGIVAARTCNGACWASCTGGLDEPSAAQRCAAWGGRLAPLQTQADYDCAHTVVLPGIASWTGFEQAPGQTSNAAGWSWNSDGVAPTFFNWSGGQPNDTDGTENGAEQCAYMSNPSGAWQDTPCTGASQFAYTCRHD